LARARRNIPDLAKWQRASADFRNSKKVKRTTS
jgi:hypothetical protein